MACPTRLEQAQGRKGSIYSDKEFVPSDKSRFLAMEYDYKRGSLPSWKIDEYNLLKEKYENDKC